MRVPGRAWKWLGVAGLAGVAASGVLVARDQRQRRQVSPEEVRDQLHRRLADLDVPTEPTATTATTERDG